MAVTAKVYASLSATIGNKEINLGSDSIKAMLCTSTYTPNQGTHKYKSDVTNEISGTGYTATGVALTSVTWTGSGNVWSFGSANVSWTTASFTARYLVLYDATPATDATRPLLGYVDFGADTTVTASTFAVNPTGGVWFTLTAS